MRESTKAGKMKINGKKDGSKMIDEQISLKEDLDHMNDGFQMDPMGRRVDRDSQAYTWEEFNTYY